MRPKLIGVTGSMQTGKQELGPTFERLGFEFLDLNQFADFARVEYRDRYEALGLGLQPNGKETGLFFQMVAHILGLHRATMEIELPVVARETKKALAGLSTDRPVVVSWGYVYQLLAKLEPEFVLLTQTNQRVWLERLHRRLPQLGGAFEGVTDEQILELAATIEMMPEPIEAAVRAHMGDRYAVVDTSGDDWGAASLIETVSRLGW